MNKYLILFLLSVLVAGNVLAAASNVNWEYEGEDGPAHWGELSPDFSLCTDGMNQSPVNLVDALDVDLPELIFQYHGTPLRELNNGHTIRIDVSPGSFLEIPEKDLSFEFKQAHFHSPSEHTLGGEHYDMEIHLVHADEDGHLAVVGILIEEGEEMPLLNRIWAFMPEKPGESTESPLTVFESGLMPPTRDYFNYNGSLTTPPCSEGVRWIVLRDTLTASAEQIERFKQRVGAMTNRPPQDLNARSILN